MCEANTYLLDEDGNEKLLLEPVDRVILSKVFRASNARSLRRRATPFP